MNRETRKARHLKLNRETLRALDVVELREIAGGLTNGPACITRECTPETQSCQYTACAGNGNTCTAT